MAYRRFFMEGVSESSRELKIEADLFHHLRDVCRFQVGDRFELLPGNQTAVLVEIQTLNKRELFVNGVSSRSLPDLPKPHITLCVSIPKLPKMDWIIEKCVELGVAQIRPFVSDYSFLRKVAEVSPNRLARWQKLMTAATQQSGRGDLMNVLDPVTLEDLLREFNRTSGAGGLFPYEGQAQVELPDAIAQLKAQDPKLEQIWLFVGSEGGFSKDEVALFGQAGLQPVSMGEQILRVETACLALVSIIKYEVRGLK